MLNLNTSNTSPCDKGLVDNIIKFSRLLKRNGVPVSLASVLDVARGMHFVDITKRGSFRSLLRVTRLS